MAIDIGTRLGRYEIRSLIGAGGMGEVYLAHDTQLARPIAVKVLPAAVASDAERMRRFTQEARSAAALNHPAIAHIYEIGEAGGTHFIAMEYVDGVTLREKIYREKTPLARLLGWLQQAAEGLAKAHAAGFVHRDLKPDNIMVTRDGHAKVLDFGLTKLLEVKRPGGSENDRLGEAATAALPQHSAPGLILGTIGYMSPEQAQGRSADIDHRSDVFSFGCILFEASTGHKPFEADSVIGSLHKIVYESAPFVKEFNPSAPPELQRIIRRCLAKDPEDRYQTIKDVAIELRDLRREMESGVEVAMTVPTSGPGEAASRSAGQISAAGAGPAAGTGEVKGARQSSSAEYIVTEIKRHKRGAAIVLMVLLLAVGGLAFGWSRGGRPPATAPAGSAPRVGPFTSLPGRECCPSFSPDGNQIAFVMWGGERGDNADIYVQLIDAGSPLRLTTQPGPDLAPAWSPDGRHIAFVRSGGETRGVFLVPALGGPERSIHLLPSDPASIATGFPALSWSPDGERLVFAERSSPEEPFGIMMLSMDTLEKRRLTSPSAATLGDFSPAVSPDGETVAFMRTGTPGSNGQIHLVAMAGGAPRRLDLHDRFQAGQLAWTADGREIVFVSSGGGANSGLWRVPITGGTSERLAAIGEYAATPAISRQGNRLAYTHNKSDFDIWRYELPGSESLPGPPIRLVASTRHESGPQYSPDGKKIVFSSERSGNLEIWVCESDGERPVQLTNFGGLVGSPRWSPDGRQITFDAVTDGHRDIYTINIGGGNPRRITTDGADDVRPSWSRDGRWIYFGSNRTGVWQVWKAPAEGGPASQVTHQGGFEGFESFAGQLVYYTKGQGLTSLWRIPATGGDEVQVLESVRLGYWAVHEQGIYFVTAAPTSQPRIEFLDFATSRRVTVAEIEKAVAGGPPGFALSPDGRWALLALVDRPESDIMLVEHFR